MRIDSQGHGPVLVWFRKDLRLTDNPALQAAIQSGRPVIPLYILDETPGVRPMGGASLWWLDKSLAALGADIDRRGGRLILRRGAAATVLSEVIAQTDAAGVVWNRLYDKASIDRDAAIKADLRGRGLACESFNASLLNEPWTVKNGSGEGYKVFTPYWRAAREHIGDVPAGQGDKFLSEVGWREFNHSILFHRPDITTANFRSEFDAFPWNHDEAAFEAWTKGQTGYPIVDAGMRELWTTGFMHNRVRMIVASFLIKHLLIDWRQGEAWFWDTLLDADLANNVGNWQWTAGSGADAAPYFRIFNPISQGEKFDAKGIYVRRWVPELSSMPDAFIHKPWMSPAHLSLGAKRTYGRPIVDHATARARALVAYQSLKGG